MELDRINMNNINGVMDLENIDIEEFNKIREVFKFNLDKLGINVEDMKMFYQRNEDATSVLAVQVTKGLDNDVSNYMINGCKAWNHGSSVNCDVYLHAEAKSAQKSVRLASLITKDVVSFFENVENGLLKSNNFDLSFSIMMPIEEVKEKEDTGVKKLIKRFFKNKK